MAIEKPSVRTQFLIFTLFGEFILPRGGSIWTGNLLSLLDQLGVGERAARLTLSRMSRKGWLATRKEGRRSQYSLTPRGWSLLVQGGKRIFELPFKEWDGMWQIVVFSLPEKKRSLRHTFRTRLPWYGFGQLAPNMWISPHNRKTEILALCNELVMQDHVEIFSGIHMGPSEDQELVRRCWNLSHLATQYKRFIAKFEKEYLTCKNNGSQAPKADDCFVRRFWLMHHFQNFPRVDPNLPAALLPPDWVGSRARQLFNDYHGILEKPANEFVDKIVSTEIPH
ncbi:MAG TPA: PaaX family transcriptional regulator C-terminal domain-containing protein [Anaerolineales bacterium]